MGSKVSLPQTMKIVQALAAAADAAGRAAPYVSAKLAGKVYIKVSINQGNAAPVTITPVQALDNAGTGAKALGQAARIWANPNTGASDTLVRQTDGVAFTTDVGVNPKFVLIEIDPAYMDVTNGFSFISFSTSASNAANITQADYLLPEYKYQQQTPPTALS